MSKLKTTLIGLCVSASLASPIFSAAGWGSSEFANRKRAEVTKQVNLNAADVATLQKLPHLGKTRAKAIIDYRASHGNFTGVNDLFKVKGIGKPLLKKIAPYLTVV